MYRVQVKGYRLKGVQEGFCEINMKTLLIMIVAVLELLVLFVCYLKILFKIIQPSSP